MPVVSNPAYDGKALITRVKMPLINRICDEVVSTLNSKSRATGYKGKGIAGRFIPEAEIPAFKAALSDYIRLTVSERGYDVPRSHAPINTPEEMHRIVYDFRQSIQKCYDWMHNGRLDIEAFAHINKLIATTLEKAGLPNTNPDRGPTGSANNILIG